MPFQNCPGIATLIPAYSIRDTDIAENVLHVSTTGAWTATLLTQLANVYITWEATTTAGVLPKSLRSSTTSLLSVTCRDLTTQTSAESVVVPAGGPIVGTNGGGDEPAGVTFAVKLATGTPGRSFRGRLYWVGVTKTMESSDPNVIASATAASMVTAMANLITAINTANAAWNLCVLSRYANHVLRGSGIGTNVQNAATADLNFDYQRRRAPAHGRHH